MSNAFGNYDETFFAQEALIWLKNKLGFASRVHRGYDPSPQAQGSTIAIRRPMTFTATDMPASDTETAPESVNVTLNKWKGVTIALTDKDLALSSERIVTDHVGPMVNAVAKAIDSSVAALYADVPWYSAATATPSDVSDITAIWQGLFDNKVPMDDGNLHVGLSGERYAKFLKLLEFSQNQGSGAQGISTQLTGSLGVRYGMEFFATQQVPSHDTTAIGSITQLQLNANAAAGATSVVIKDSDGTLTGSVTAGDSFVIAGNTQRYAITAAATASGNLLTVSVTPPLVQAYSADDNVTLRQSDKTVSLAFHKDAFCLAMAPLSTMGDGLGARIATVTDEETGLTLRSRMWYEGSNAKVKVGIDALWGVKTLNPNLAWRYEV